MKDSVFEWTLGRAERLGEIMGTIPTVGVGHILAPGGLGTFLLENTVFKGDMFAAIAGNHHCGVNFGGTGGICTLSANLTPGMTKCFQRSYLRSGCPTY